MIKDVTEKMIVPMESMKLIVEYVLELNSNVKRRVLVSSTWNDAMKSTIVWTVLTKLIAQVIIYMHFKSI